MTQQVGTTPLNNGQGNTKGRLIQIKQGLSTELTYNLQIGELCLLTDTLQIAVGTPDGNKLINLT
jgi:hypothetical protein